MKKMFNKMSNTVKTMTCKAHCAMTCAHEHQLKVFAKDGQKE